MKNRKRGFSLVELLIVLAVIAALIATITPVALNAIKKAKATQVAQNLKTLASALENAAYVNGAKSTVGVYAPGATLQITQAQLARDIDNKSYAIIYKWDGDNSKFVGYVVFVGDVDVKLLTATLSNASQDTWAEFKSEAEAKTNDWAAVGDVETDYPFGFITDDFFSAATGDNALISWYNFEFTVY
ncbi:prepilin-type N-terminal cleavage/methylation domain-containing protein [Mesotoga sp. UBA5557]|jgi:general secretion pathway protein G|uniref:prepilin-type N-terminal cleavage/methylation domain-containing protein n=1 Tax=Mesotoga sp. UBA5557 TaxID=1946857 RepID=UPI0025E5275F|nr:type II secretion system protein [Mesotoga sp. UBA5557]